MITIDDRDDCEKYDYLDRCYKPPPCSKTCLAAAKNEQCPSECEQFRGKSECCFECPVMCKEAYNDGDSDERCAKYSYLPQCYRECPTKCEESFKNGVTDRDCERFASVPGCYYTPCPQACMTAAANDQCPRQVLLPLTFFSLNFIVNTFSVRNLKGTELVAVDVPENARMLLISAGLRKNVENTMLNTRTVFMRY